MSDRILVPVLGESVTEATVAKWLKNEGDKVNTDEAIVELETDKVNVEVPAPSSGVIEKISVKEGQTVNVGALLGTIAKSDNVKVSSDVEEKKYSPPSKKIEIVKKEIVKEEIVDVINKKEESFEERKKEIVEEPFILTEDHSEEKISNPSANIVSPAARKRQSLILILKRLKVRVKMKLF